MSVPDTAQAFWVTRPGHGAIQSEPLPAMGQNDVRVRALYSGVSRGTESLVFHGRVPSSETQRMRAPFQVGEFPGPVKYGYCSVGRVTHGPQALVDQTVFCLHPHQDRYIVPATMVVPVPADVPAYRAVLAANMETAINGVWERVCVVGGGVVGALVAYLCARIAGVQVQLIDINGEREALADALGVPFALPEQAPADQDCVIHASGHPEGLRLAMSLVGQLPAKLQPRWNYQRRLALALRLLADPTLDVLISGESNFMDLPALAPALFGPGSKALCHRIRYPVQDEPE